VNGLLSNFCRSQKLASFTKKYEGGLQITLLQLLSRAPWVLAVECGCCFGAHAQLGASGGFLHAGAPSALSDTQRGGQVGPWEEDTGRGSCRALTQPSSPSKGASQHPASPLPRGVRTGVPLPASRHHPATTCPCHRVTPLRQNFFSLPPPVSAMKIMLALSASLQVFKGLPVTQQIPVDPSGLGPGL